MKNGALVALLFPILVSLLVLGACAPAERTETTAEAEQAEPAVPLDKYTEVTLVTDQQLSDNERQVLRLLIEASEPMNGVFWYQAFGSPDRLWQQIEDPDVRRFAEINFGPWDRLAGNAPFVEGYGPKPAGANFYPEDMLREELENAVEEALEQGNEVRADALVGLYTMIRRGETGALEPIAYRDVFADAFGRSAEKLREAAAITDDPQLARYLELRAEALLSDDYLASDLAWMEMKDNRLDVVIGPIETYEDQLFGYKAAAEAFVLVKDLEWSARLARYAELLPDLQRALPIEEAFKAESPGTDADLNAYDVVFVAGDANAGSKTIAINLPNDERVQLEKGTRRLQLKNAMRAKYDAILLPLADVLIDPEQRQHVTFDAFFANTMFHEVAHGLGIKNVVGGSTTVRHALQEHASAFEEGKADVLGLFMVTWLAEQGELGEEVDLRDYYTTFLASIFRSIRFGSASAHGRANLMRFNYFAEQGAFERDDVTGTYRIDMAAMREAVNRLGERILRLQGEGDHAGATEFLARYGTLGDTLAEDLARVASAGIPVDIVYRQGIDVLGL